MDTTPNVAICYVMNTKQTLEGNDVQMYCIVFIGNSTDVAYNLIPAISQSVLCCIVSHLVVTAVGSARGTIICCLLYTGIM